MLCARIYRLPSIGMFPAAIGPTGIGQMGSGLDDKVVSVVQAGIMLDSRAAIGANQVSFVDGRPPRSGD